MRSLFVTVALLVTEQRMRFVESPSAPIIAIPYKKAIVNGF